MLNTLELGPHLNTAAPNFCVGDHNQTSRKLDDLMGPKGLVLGFLVDIWLSASVRRIIWLQRHASTFIRAGYNVALVVCDQPHMLYGYYISSPTPLEFPLLADVRGDVHRLYRMAHHPGLVLLDHQRVIRHKWLMPDERVWPKIQEMLDVMNRL
ncbi:MAG: redoxin domain-containing protein [Chloroflexi bacterium]|nr:redoxin domain-containing protein [Chloroflexota bacterium]